MVYISYSHQADFDINLIVQKVHSYLSLSMTVVLHPWCLYFYTVAEKQELLSLHSPQLIFCASTINTNDWC